MLVQLKPWAMLYHFDQVVYANSVVYGDTCFCSGGLEAEYLRHANTTCLDNSPTTRILDKAQVSFCCWQHFANVVIHHSWKNEAYSMKLQILNLVLGVCQSFTMALHLFPLQLFIYALSVLICNHEFKSS